MGAHFDCHVGDTDAGLWKVAASPAAFTKCLTLSFENLSVSIYVDDSQIPRLREVLDEGLAKLKDIADTPNEALRARGGAR